MYQINSKKRYDVTIKQRDLNIFTKKNVKLLSVGQGFVAFEDGCGKEHIFTGEIGIYIDEA